ncbi:hypothetical protein KBAHV46_06630 [Aeromonas hydrophila]|nr:hypothetical protein KBAHV42_06620 [Aeromonas hydrophila]CAD7509891.1 hypothetical protein KBAHV27_06610 [Aeromonas hydrophila]CAD7510079.1 hypothetical protein KBAHV46_06630 [Aeromonas hydrophila]CAD7511734.1 hypothetical protein KBAHV22_06620 [Aeromonas hydrophila]CAD7511863.1 hypothetical protein KBAHV01_06730 [Aeromonas hydrophila]
MPLSTFSPLLLLGVLVMGRLLGERPLSVATGAGMGAAAGASAVAGLADGAAVVCAATGAGTATEDETAAEV